MSTMTRRSILARSVAAGAALIAPTASAMPATASPTMPPTADPDAELLALVDEYIAAEQETVKLYEQCSRIGDQVHAHVRQIEQCDALRVRAEDRELGLPEPFDDCLRRNVKAEFYRSPDIDRLASAQWRRFENVTLPENVWAIANADDPIRRGLDPTSYLIAFSSYTPSKEARQRADEIVAALRAKQKAEKSADRKFGLRRAEREANRASSRACRLSDRIAEMDAHTMAGIMGKVRCVAINYKKGEITVDTGHGGDELALSIAADLARFGAAVS